MKKLKTTAILICLLFVFSCSERKNKGTEEQIIQNQTPDVLDDKNSPELASISKRYELDIIQELYQEAMDKNQDLKSLNTKIEEISSIKNDSLKAYRIYIQNNDNYFAIVENYLNQLSDSTIKNEVKEIFTKLENGYLNKISKHEIGIEKINNKSVVLNDRLILMKLFVTEPMMSIYQENELPDIKSINYIIEKYDSLIVDTKTYVKIQ